AKGVADLKSPVMIIPVLKEYAHMKTKVQEIANNIEVMKLGQFVFTWQIFFEKFGEIVHSKYTHEQKIVDDFLKMNPLLKPPSDLIKWCIRIVINKTMLILKNMSLELIVNKIHDIYPDLYVVYTPENSSEVIVRIYIRSSMKDSKGNFMFKGHIDH